MLGPTSYDCFNVRQRIALIDACGQLILTNEQLFKLLDLLPNRVDYENATSHALLTDAVCAGSFGVVESEVFVGKLFDPTPDASCGMAELRDLEGRVLEIRHTRIADGRSILTVDDVSERHKLVRLKDEFISTASHELRTPLTSIRGALAILGRKSEDKLDEQGRQMLGMASRNAERLTELINDILDIGKLTSPEITMNQKEVDVYLDNL